MSYTAQEKLDAVERELSYRRRVYQRRIDSGNLKAETAHYQVSVFEEIAADYERQLEAERLL